MLTNFYKSKKDDFQTQMTAYLNNQNLNFVNLFTSQIITNENGTKLIKQKIKTEIENVENKEDDQFKKQFNSINTWSIRNRKINSC